MKVKELEQIVHREPFQPYRLVLVNGEEVLVNRADKSHVSGETVALVGICRGQGLAAVERFRMIHADRVISAELVGKTSSGQ